MCVSVGGGGGVYFYVYFLFLKFQLLIIRNKTSSPKTLNLRDSSVRIVTF